MPRGIAKGVRTQIGGLGKHVAKDVAKLPKTLTGLDTKGTDESLSASKTSQSKKAASPAAKSDKVFPYGEVNILQEIANKDEQEKQKKLAQARELLRQFTTLPERDQPSPREQIELEEMEKKKMKIKEEKEKAKKILPEITPKKPRGDLYGIAGKQFGGEKGKNIKVG